MRIISQLDPQNDGSHPGASSSFSDTWLESVKKRCQPSVRVWKVSEESEEHEEANEKTSVATMITTLLVQESSTSTKCQALLYDFDEPKHANNLKGMRNENKENDGDSPIVKYNNHIIWTREPRETRLSLDDLVSHRKNNGVDNTGNICVWDSERTLAYLLYHHFDDFFNQNMIQPQILENENRSGIRILELGTGMAGLSAVALGLRLAMRQEEHGDRIKEGNASKDENEKEEKKSIHITLTDGNPSGVKNNVVNQYLTKLNSQTMWQGEGYCSHYLDLNVDCETLLWTTDLESEKERPVNQDVVLVSDCVHFQNFHAALATTALRCLRTGASAIFCQPTRGPSLDNFLNLLLAATLDKDPIGSTSLLSYTWLSHPIIEKEDHEARLHYSHVYDKNLHHPKILVITKLREISEEDRNRFVAYQHRYSPIVPKTVEGT
jgi:predicted nicotinamide N-methyase